MTMLRCDTVVLIPARNEPAIYDTLASIARQTELPLLTVVVINNCTDGGETVRLVRRAERDFAITIHVLEMPHNPYKKAGALNYGYDYIDAHLPQVRWAVQMDADSVLAEDFVALTASGMCRRKLRPIGALSCAFTGKPGLPGNWWQRLVMWLQALEYVTYHDSGITKNVNVISGTGCLLRMEALRQLKRQRGFVWHNQSLVEDYELTLALRAIGWETRKSLKFRVYTDLMPTVRSLVEQRQRWQRGTFEELRRYGWTKFTAFDIMKQWAFGLLTLLNMAGWMIFVSFAMVGSVTFQPVFLVLLATIMLRRAYHARSMGWKSVLAALSLVPETLYGMLRTFWWTKSLVLSFTSKNRAWA